MQRTGSNLSAASSVSPLAHVHLRPLARLEVLASGSRSWTYDDAHKQLLVSADNKLLCWDLGPGGAHGGPSPSDAANGAPAAPSSPRAQSPHVSFLSQGPVIAARFSCDRRLLAIQRSRTEVEFVNQEDGSQFWQRCKGGDLLGFFWCDGERADVAMVTTAGLELYKLLDSRKGLQLKDTKKHTVKWYK